MKPLLKWSLSPICFAYLSMGVTPFHADSGPATICNPLDPPYRFTLSGPSHREAADLSVIYFKGEFWLFASRSGYWHSFDFVIFVEPTSLPLESYVPTIEAIDGKLYFTVSGGGIFTTDDGRLYFYDGCSDKDPIQGRELDRANGFAASAPVDLVAGDRPCPCTRFV